MSDEVPDIQRRVPFAIEIKVDQVEAGSVHQDLRRVKIAMDAAGLRRRHARAETITALQDAVDAAGQRRSGLGHARKTLVQNAKLIGHGVSSVRRHPRPVQLMEGFGDASRQRASVGSRQQRQGHAAGDLALKPHLKPRNHPYRLRDRDPVGASALEARVPERVQQSVALVARAACPDFADQRHFQRRDLRVSDPNVVLDDTTLAGLVARDLNGSDQHSARCPSQAWQPMLELRPDFSRVQRQRHGGQPVIGGGAETIGDPDFGAVRRLRTTTGRRFDDLPP